MIDYLIIGLKNDAIVFESRETIDSKDNLNTNLLYQGCFLYEIKYIKRNILKVTHMLQKILNEKNIKKAIIHDDKIINFSIKVISYLKIENYSFGSNTLSVTQCDSVLNSRYIKSIECYYLPHVIIKRFNKRKIKVDLNYKEIINDAFLITNDVIDYDALYYKKSIKIDYSNFNIEDFKEFLNINKFLKVIHLYYYDKIIINKIIDLLNEKNIRKVIILIHQVSGNPFIQENFEFLKNINKKYDEFLDGEIRIIYSNKYVKNNLFKQLSYNNLKMSVVILLYVAFVSIFFTEVYGFVSDYNMNLLNYTLATTESSEESSSVEQSSTIKKEEPDKYAFNKMFSSLLKINKETVGWLTVNNTKINYPVTKHEDNEYYLKRDFYKNRTSNGWIFMDYRNNSKELSDNTIIYGHKLKNGSLFGTLSNVLDKSWYTNPDNLLIEFDTLDYDMKWEIFSIYRTEYTTDYLETDFDNKDEYDKFINMITKRSIKDFKNKPEYKTKIITLSTCTGYSYQNKRLVVHAYLVEKEEN